MPVTGRGFHGELPDTYNGFNNNFIAPLFDGETSIPLNIEAKLQFNNYLNSEDENIRTAAKNKEMMQQPKLYTSLEKKLYGLLMALNLAVPIYAQYSAGPTFDYQLDAAIPTLGIGIEADGEIWHNNVNKITKDKQIDSELANNGWAILRFTDKELNDHPQDCLNVIINAIKKRQGQSTTEEITL